MEDLRVNDICLFDHDNHLKIASMVYTYCRIVRIEEKFFKKDYYIIFCDKDGNPLTHTEQLVNPYLLTKLNPNEHVVTRYPYDMPIIKEDEVAILAKMYNDVLHTIPLANRIPESDKIAIAKLIAKLQLFSAVIHQY